MAEFQPSLNRRKNRVPCCPNHGEPLEGLPHPLTPTGTGICPISKAEFDYSIDLDERSNIQEVDKNGNIKTIPTYKVTGEEHAW